MMKPSKGEKEKKARSRNAASVKGDLSLIFVQQLQCVSGCVLFDTKCLNDTQTHFSWVLLDYPMCWRETHYCTEKWPICHFSPAETPWSSVYLKLYQVLTAVIIWKSSGTRLLRWRGCEKHPGHVLNLLDGVPLGPVQLIWAAKNLFRNTISHILWFCPKTHRTMHCYHLGTSSLGRRHPLSSHTHLKG